MTLASTRLSAADAQTRKPTTSLILSAAASVAIIPATLLAANLPPSATFLNQAAAVIGWGVFGVVLAWQLMRHGAPAQPAASREPDHHGLTALLLALGVMAVACVGSWALTGLPTSLALSALGLLAAAGLLAWLGAAATSAGFGTTAFRALCVALVGAGLLSVAVGAVQVFVPAWADGQWIAATSHEGRAAGNLRQPNHLSSLLLWSLVAALWLAESASTAALDPVEALRRRGGGARPGLLVLVCVLVFGTVLSASRTGMLGVLALAVWGVLDRNMSRRTRTLLCVSPLLYALCWGGLSGWAEMTGHVFGSAERLRTETDISSSRFGIWSNTLALIAQHPWFGVGWGEFNLAWSTTPFPKRPGAFFDHTHNLPLQLVVELGAPLGLLVMGLLAWALWRGWKNDAAATATVAITRGTVLAAARTLQRSAWMMVVLVLWHSLLEYPLWYAYFLLPTAFAWGLSLGTDPASTKDLAPVAVDRSLQPAANPAATATATARTKPKPKHKTTPRSFAAPLLAGALLLTSAGVASVFDYLRVVEVFDPAANDAPLADRIAAGQRSWLFAHHADYAAAITSPTIGGALQGIAGAKHFLLDTRLMLAWANALNASGQVEQARQIAQRLREFHNPASAAFFEACDVVQVPASGLPFQCTPPTGAAPNQPAPAERGINLR